MKLVSAFVGGGILGGAIGYAAGYNQGYNVGYSEGYQRAKWEMEQQMASLRAEFTDQIRQLQAQINDVARTNSNYDQRLTQIERLMGQILTILEAEASGR